MRIVCIVESDQRGNLHVHYWEGCDKKLEVETKVIQGIETNIHLCPLESQSNKIFVGVWIDIKDMK